MKPKFRTDDRIRFDIRGDGTITGNGTILGQTSGCAEVTHYAVLYDVAIQFAGMVFKGGNLPDFVMENLYE